MPFRVNVNCECQLVDRDRWKESKINRRQQFVSSNTNNKKEEILLLNLYTKWAIMPQERKRVGVLEEEMVEVV